MSFPPGESCAEERAYIRPALLTGSRVYAWMVTGSLLFGSPHRLVRSCFRSAVIFLLRIDRLDVIRNNTTVLHNRLLVTVVSRFTPDIFLSAWIVLICPSPCSGVGDIAHLSLPVYAWPSGSACLLEQSLLQTVLASGASSQPEGGPLPSPRLWIWRGTAVFGWESSVWLTASSSMVPGVCRSTGVGSTPRLFTNVFGGPARQGTSYGSCRQPAAGRGHYVVQSSDPVTVRHVVTPDVVPNDGFGHGTVDVSTSRGRYLSPAPRAARAATYMSAMGLWHPQTGPGDPGQCRLRRAARV